MVDAVQQRPDLSKKITAVAGTIVTVIRDGETTTSLPIQMLLWPFSPNRNQSYNMFSPSIKRRILWHSPTVAA